MSNEPDFVVSGDFAIVGFTDSAMGGAVSAIDLKTGTTAFQARTEAVRRVDLDEKGVVVSTYSGAFNVKPPGGVEVAPPEASFGRRATPQRAMGSVTCAVALLAKALDARDAAGARQAIDWLDTLVAPRGLLRAARAAASRIERATEGTAWDLQAKEPFALAFTAPVPPRRPGASCKPAEFVVKWTDRGEPEELTKKRAEFGLIGAPRRRGGRSRSLTHSQAPESLGGEGLTVVERRGDIDTLFYGDRYIIADRRSP